jgi:guanylate kinase
MKKLIIMGKSASGKDTLRNLLLEKGLKESVSYTTRPRREGEINGKDYHFISLDQFNALEEKNFFLESEKFRDWKYGRSYESIEEGDVFIATVTGTSNMIKKLGRDKFYVLELDCSDEIRKERSLKRGDDPVEVERRLKTDDADFSAARNFETNLKLSSEHMEHIHAFARAHELLINLADKECK